MIDRAKLPIVCDKSWDELDGDENVRFCRTCMRSVWDLSEFDTPQLEALVAYHGPKICGRVRRSPDGTPVGRECEPAAMPVPGGMPMPMTDAQIAAREQAANERAASLGHDRAACPICSRSAGRP